MDDELDVSGWIQWLKTNKLTDSDGLRRTDWIWLLPTEIAPPSNQNRISIWIHLFFHLIIELKTLWKTNSYLNVTITYIITYLPNIQYTAGMLARHFWKLLWHKTLLENKVINTQSPWLYFWDISTNCTKTLIRDKNP